jgi:hypothetical protein
VKHYGTAPPWDGKNFFGLRWERGEELWDGSIVWTLRTAAGVTVTNMASILKEFYISPITEMLNAEGPLTKLLAAESLRKVPKSRAARAADWMALPWWRRLFVRRPK